MSTEPLDPQEPDPTLEGTEEHGIFTLPDIDPPPGLTWLICPGGTNQPKGRVIGPPGGTMALDDGHALSITKGATRKWLPFMLWDPPSDKVVVRVAGPYALAGAGGIIRLSWANRQDCKVADSAVIVQVRQGQPARGIQSRVDQLSRTIETTEPITQFSLFAIAQ